ncbi:hypothetical protein HY768_01155 [candidate division TA06 bacterium]|uniref:Uncharacterized protein n=1 Tax=candidate division TA06 bacterium TaxID=2250710 RepID=A0A933IAR1_UNCT6|nr:hypothetical protein [candidate division TA06 bacterium]
MNASKCLFSRPLPGAANAQLSPRRLLLLKRLSGRRRQEQLFFHCSMALSAFLFFRYCLVEKTLFLNMPFACLMASSTGLRKIPPLVTCNSIFFPLNFSLTAFGNSIFSFFGIIIVMISPLLVKSFYRPDDDRRLMKSFHPDRARRPLPAGCGGQVELALGRAAAALGEGPH